MKYPVNLKDKYAYLIQLHYERPLYHDMISITSSDDANHAFRKLFLKEQLSLKEFFGVLLLTQSNRLLGGSIVAMGSTTGVLVNIKEIFQLALLTNASGIIVGHNHPSGSLNISANDREQTDKILRLGKLMGITLLDHIIITTEAYQSFANEGLLHK